VPIKQLGGSEPSISLKKTAVVFRVVMISATETVGFSVLRQLDEDENTARRGSRPPSCETLEDDYKS